MSSRLDFELTGNSKNYASIRKFLKADKAIRHTLQVTLVLVVKIENLNICVQKKNSNNAKNSATFAMVTVVFDLLL